ncbi:hypothetical protein AAMO2058_000280100 [Amorphochlora amoebiformis]
MFFDVVSIAPKLYVQIIVAIITAGIWKIVLTYLEQKFLSYICEKPWFKATIKRDMKRVKEAIGVHVDFDSQKYNFANFTMVAVQHSIGGLICIPAVMGITGNGLGSCLVRLSALSEVGWEVADTITRVYVRVTHPKGRMLQPDGVLLFFGFHHVMGMSMVIPMNLYYSHNFSYWMLVFVMQGVSGIALMMAQYTQTLDVSKPDELLQMQVLSIVMGIFISYCRVYLFLTYCWKLLVSFYMDSTVTFIIGGIFSSVLMSVVNLIFVVDAYRRIMKFITFSLKPKKDLSQLRRASRLMAHGLITSRTSGHLPFSPKTTLVFAEKSERYISKTISFPLEKTRGVRLSRSTRRRSYIATMHPDQTLTTEKIIEEKTEFVVTAPGAKDDKTD